MVEDLGRTLLVLGALIFVAGLVLSFAGRIPGLGNLPGDIAIQRENFRLYMPCGTMLVISLLLTLVLNIIPRLFR